MMNFQNQNQKIKCLELMAISELVTEAMDLESVFNISYKSVVIGILLQQPPSTLGLSNIGLGVYLDE